MRSKKLITSFISGNFNILHPGHLRLIKFAKEISEKLIVGVFSDKLSGDSAIINQDYRLESLKSISWVDEVILIESSLEKILYEIRPNIIVKGKEHENLLNIETDICKELGTKLVFSSGDSKFSSIDLINKERENDSEKLNRIPTEFIKRHKADIHKLHEIIDSFKNLKILVIGDTIVDEYIDCNALGMSREDPTVVVSPIESKKFIGGSAIVAAHAASLGSEVYFFSVCGQDKELDFVKSELKKINVKTFIEKDSSRPTTLKKRYRSDNKTLLRVSHLQQREVSKEFEESILKKIKKLINKIDLIVFSDFNYGVITSKIQNDLTDLAKNKNIIITADSQSSSQIGDIGKFINMDLITPTEREARISLMDKDSGLVTLADKLKNKCNAKNVLLKIGEEGLIIHSEVSKNDKWHTDRILPLNNKPVDVSGAGDSLLITSSMALACKANIWEAALIGSIAAASQISKTGNIPLTLNDLKKYLKLS